MVMIVRPESTTKRHGINLYASGVALLCFCSPAFAQSEAPAEQPAAQSAAAEAPQSESLGAGEIRSEEHTSELQSLMRISYAVFCLKKKTRSNDHKHERKKQLHDKKTIRIQYKKDTDKISN